MTFKTKIDFGFNFESVLEITHWPNLMSLGAIYALYSTFDH